MCNLYSCKNVFFVIILSLFLSACGGGNETGDKLSGLSATGVTEADTPINSDTSITLSGSVGDGPVAGATVVIKNASGKTLKSVLSDQQAKYSVNIEVSATDYPLLIEASGGIDLVTDAAPDFILYSVISDPSVKIANLNPFSTMIVKTAEFMTGGLNSANIKIAKSNTLSQLNFGLDSTLVPDPISTPISQSNIAVIVKSSETFGEMIRRTRDTLKNGKTADEIILDLAEDLTDGDLDGVSKNGIIPKTSSVSRLVSVQVLLEALSNDLMVGGTNAAKRMDDSIMESMPGIEPSTSTADVLITGDMLSQAIDAIDRATSKDNSSTLTPIAMQLSSLQSGSTASDISPFKSSRLNPIIVSANNSTPTTTATPTPTPVNNKPVISGSPRTSIREGSRYRFAPSYSDRDGDPLRFRISNKPNWASFNSSTGVLSGTPGMQDARNYPSIRISVTDGTDYTYLPAFSIRVNNLNRAPSISGSPRTSIAEGSRYRFAPSYSDRDGDPLRFRISNKPSWASFNSSTGVLSGTPGMQDARNYPSIRISVSDGTDDTYLPAFSITVNNLNRAPSISGSPATTTLASSRYSFTPSSRDADGDRLTFSITNKPGWATFNTRTGALTGTPSIGAVGNITRNISISVSDGQTRRSLKSFDIEVLGSSNGSVTLSWMPPTENTDNTALSDLAGFKIFYGTTPGVYPNSIDIKNPSISSYIIDNLPSNTYYFVIAAYNSAGISSAYSNEATKVIN
ncbi:MAG TPA: hypothetical protein ENI98_00285 [Gammaproteobacteria bacterium]|nr:hypothetical protein [Gammaproteobacteria bacterium]